MSKLKHGFFLAIFPLIPERNDRSRKSLSSSITIINPRSATPLSSTNNVRSGNNLRNDNNHDDNELQMESDDVSFVVESNTQKQSTKENIGSNRYPFEIEETRSKKTSTASGKKLAMQVYELFEKQADGIYRCTLCTDQQKVTGFLPHS